MRALCCAARSGVLWSCPYISSYVLNGRCLGFESNKSVFLLLPRIHSILCMTQPKRLPSALLSYIIPREEAALMVLLAPGIFPRRSSTSDCLSLDVRRSRFTGPAAVILLSPMSIPSTISSLSAPSSDSRIALPDLQSKPSHQCGYSRHVTISHFTFHISHFNVNGTGYSHTSSAQLILHKKVCLVFRPFLVLAPDDHL